MTAPPSHSNWDAQTSSSRLSDVARLQPWLLGVLAGAGFWSTALLELAVGAVMLHALVSLKHRSASHRSSLDRPVRWSLVLWGVYALSVLLSLSISGTLFTAHAGRIWHALLFPAVLFTPVSMRDLRKVAGVFIVSGLTSAVAILIVNLASGFDSPAIVFTGLTTVADLTALLTIVLLAALAAHVVPGYVSAGAGIFATAMVFWTGERAPVGVLASAGTALVALTRPRVLLLWCTITVAFFLLSPQTLRARTDWLMRGNRIDRYIVWEDGLRQLQHVSLFGNGPESFDRLVSAEARGRFAHRPPASWHNDLIQTTFDSGPIAALALAGLIILAAVPAFRRAWSRRNRAEGLERATPLILFACLTAFGAVGSVITTSVLGALFWCLMAFVVESCHSQPGDAQ